MVEVGNGAAHRRWRTAIGTMLLIAVVVTIGWLTREWASTADWSQSGRNTLSTTSHDVAQRLTAGPLKIRATFEAESPLRRTLSALVERYRAVKADITLEFKDAVSSVANDGVISSNDGDVQVEYNGRTRPLRGLSEQHLTSVLLALLRGDERWLVFVTGHGERDPLGKGNDEWGTFGDVLQAKGFRLHHLNLAAMQQIPDNTSAMVIASSRVAWLPGEIAVVQDFLARGGNLWWLVEPNVESGLDSLAATLGVTPQAGLVIDPAGQRLSVQNPAYAVVTQYDPTHALLRDFKLTTVFPYATRVMSAADAPWRATTLMTTAENAWFETGSTDSDVQFDAGQDGAGPVPLALALERPSPRTGVVQRAIVVGDGDFLSNRYVGNGGNAELGVRMANWLSRDEALVDLPVHDADDRALELSSTQTAVLGFGVLIGIPALFLIAGGVLLWRRRRQ